MISHHLEESVTDKMGLTGGSRGSEQWKEGTAGAVGSLNQRKTQTCTYVRGERRNDREIEIYFKELASTTMGAGKPKLFRKSQQAGNGRN